MQSERNTQLKINAAAQRRLEKLPYSVQNRIQRYLGRVLAAQSPRQLGRPTLHQKRGNWRYRIGQYRLLCQIDKESVFIYRVGKRESVYGRQ